MHSSKIASRWVSDISDNGINVVKKLILTGSSPLFLFYLHVLYSSNENFHTVC